MCKVFECFIFGVLVFLASFGSANADGLKIEGTYMPEEIFKYFKLIGDARLGTDETGNVRVIFGSVVDENRSSISYEVLFMMCDDEDTQCGKITIRYDWHADRDDVWCAIRAWEELGEYENRAWAGFAFDKVRLIRDQFGFNGSSGQPVWLFVQLWRQELLEFHALTGKIPETCA